MPDVVGSPGSALMGVATPTSSSATPTGSARSGEDARVVRKRSSLAGASTGARSRRSSRQSGELAAYYDFSKRRSDSIVQDEPGTGGRRYCMVCTIIGLTCSFVLVGPARRAVGLSGKRRLAFDCVFECCFVTIACFDARFSRVPQAGRVVAPVPLPDDRLPARAIQSSRTPAW